ncbi:hypothetical protein [Arthrobacter alkaliphilus]|uniref:hypothetical protein n=1 Tax=Arthrobacter alkaliphilus TaxID=369936 RepID=UPI001F413127|nr:hypothetical protein [Arthrobacter alkaliphilus]
MYQYISFPDAPARLLRTLLYELHAQAYSARNAGQRLLEGPEWPWDDVQLLISHSATVGTFLWPLPSRNRRLREAFPARGEVLRRIVNVSTDLSPIKNLRDAMVHIDEKLETFILDHPDDPLILRSTGIHEHTTGNFLSWIPGSKTVTFFEHQVEVEPLVNLLAQIGDNASRAVFMSPGSGDVLAGDPFKGLRPFPVLPPMFPLPPDATEE